MRKSLRSVFILPLLALLSTGQSSATIHNVQVGSSGFNPNVYTPNILTCDAGDTVQFNFDFGMHSVESTTIPAGAATFTSPMLTSGIYLVIPVVAGTYNYVCGMHPNMTGSFTVNPGSSAPTTPSVSPIGPVTICSGNAQTLTASSTGATGWQWSNGSGPIPGATNVTYDANASGTYTVTASNANGSSAASVPVQVMVNQTPVISATHSQTNICQMFCDTITMTGATTYSLSINPQGMATVSGNQIFICPDFSTSPSVYLFGIDGTSNGCPATIQETITVNPTANPSFTHTHTGLTYNFTNTSTNTTSGASYSWTFGDGQNGTGPNPSHTYPTGGSYMVTLFVNNGASCFSASVQTIDALGIGNIPGAQNFSFSPNPAGNTLTINPGGLQAQIGLYDYTGKFIMDLTKGFSKSGYTVDIAAVPAGLYMVSIKANGVSAMEKVVIQH
jgi:PKD repeat protein